MKITLRQLEYLAALVDLRNFGRAAKQCNVSQPALSVQIRALERALGGALVERHARDVVPTPLGRETLVLARRILRDVSLLQQNARRHGGVGGHLSLGIIPTVAPYFLPAALAALRGRDIDLDVQVTEARTGRLLDLLLDGRLDVGVMALPAATGGLEERVLFEDRFLLAGSAARLAAAEAGAGALRPTALGDAPLMLLEDGHCLTDQALEICGRGRGHHRINTGASSLATLSRLVEAGFGLTLMPELAAAAECRAAPEMRLARFAPPEPARHIGLVRRAGGGPAPWFDDLAELLAATGRALIEAARASGGRAAPRAG